MNLANKITVLRIVLTFVFMFFLFLEGFIFKVVAFVVFSLAAASDLIDGWIAKTRNQITDFGKIMDPIADKILTLAAFLSFVELQLVPAWMVVVIIFRELIITSLRLFALSKGKVLAAVRAGKHKTVSQVVSIFLILGFIILKEIFKNMCFWNELGENLYFISIYVVMLVTVVLTLISGISYLWKNRKLIIKL
ncbi:MAG: CDP-diacylglycerol--glycerol-3-phosphate 3-phosphatidyltransferase [Candidatus Gygaella obscura]|nr:CDP-diacylglycerol--glycerol-3-phosphate 3-phosphatidyltransferase [Candidatus Gygaella obscura]